MHWVSNNYPQICKNSMRIKKKVQTGYKNANEYYVIMIPISILSLWHKPVLKSLNIIDFKINITVNVYLSHMK